MRTLFLTWTDHQRRTEEMCAGLGLELIVLRTRTRGLLRYLLLGARTIMLLVRHPVDVLVVQSPSLVLAALAVTLRALLRYRLIVDAHNEAVVPYLNRQKWIERLTHWVIRRADMTIVSNRQLADVVRSLGGRAFALPDRIPVAPAALASAQLPGCNVALIATHASDEPIAEVFEAVRGTDIVLHVTGNPRKLAAHLAGRIPPNVRFTGYLPNDQYWQLLRDVDAIIDLSLMDNCLVSGSYEAVAVGTPMLLSANAACMELFGDAALYTDNTAADIRSALARLRKEQPRLKEAIARKHAEMNQQWQQLGAELMKLVSAHPMDAPKVING